MLIGGVTVQEVLLLLLPLLMMMVFVDGCETWCIMDETGLLATEEGWLGEDPGLGGVQLMVICVGEGV